MDSKKMSTPSTQAEQDGRKMTRDMANLGHPANDVINPHWQSAQNQPNPPHAGDHEQSSDTREVGVDQGSKGSGTPTLSGAGQLADDRPGRDEPKSDHASSSLNTHE